MTDFGGLVKKLTASNILNILLAVLLLNAWFLHYGGMGGGDCDTSKLDEQIEGLTTEKGWLQANLTQAKADVAAFQSNQTGPCTGGEFNQSQLDSAVAAEKAEWEEKLDKCRNETGISIEAGSLTEEEMRDWAAIAKLKLSTKTNVRKFELFTDIDEALSFVTDTGFSWDTSYSDSKERKENIDRAATKIADEHKEDDPAKSIFFSAKDIFVLVPDPANGILPKTYKLDKDADGNAVFESTSIAASVKATDELKKSDDED